MTVLNTQLSLFNDYFTRLESLGKQFYWRNIFELQLPDSHTLPQKGETRKLFHADYKSKTVIIDQRA